MNTNLTKLWSWLKTLPVWLRCVVLALLSALAIIASMSMSACGATKATVTNRAQGTVTEIKITTNNPTSVQTTPNVNLEYTPKNE